MPKLLLFILLLTQKLHFSIDITKKSRYNKEVIKDIKLGKDEKQ